MASPSCLPPDTHENQTDFKLYHYRIFAAIFTSINGPSGVRGSCRAADNLREF